MNPHTRPFQLPRAVSPARPHSAVFATARALLAGLAFLCYGVSGCHAADILILLSRSGELQNTFAEALSAGLETGGRHHVRTASLGDDNQDPAMLPDVDVIVAVGAAACRAATRDGRTPVLATLVSRHEAVDLRQRSGNQQLAVIVLDQPMLRTLNLARLVAPGATSVAALFAAGSSAAETAFRNGATSIGLRPQSTLVHDEELIGPALDRLLERNEVLVAFPDALIFNRNTAMSILLTSYRYRRPVIGFSEAYVRAGAIAAVFSSPGDIARQAAEWLNSAPPAMQLASQIREPRYFRVVVNERVAEALGLEPPNAEKLAQTLRTLEGPR